MAEKNQRFGKLRKFFNRDSKKPDKSTQGNIDSNKTTPPGLTVTDSTLSSSGSSVGPLCPSGGASSSINNSSTFEIFCDPCSTVRDYVEAEGYCSDCKEYYCQQCYRSHSKSIATRNHTLLDQSAMPTISITPAPASISNIDINKGSDADDTQFEDEFQFNRDINIKYPHEKKDCYIVGMTVIADSELVIIDSNNKSVKMLNVDQNIMNGILFFDTVPDSITTIPNREVAVTFHGENLIRVLATSGGLYVKRVIKLSGQCLAVDYCNGKLYVSYSGPVKFQILGLTGGVKKTIKPDDQVLHHCTCPRHIAVHSDESQMYVSDWQRNIVLCMDMTGTMLYLYNDVGLESPNDITFTPFSSIYLCNRKQHIIYKLSADLSEACVVLGPRDGLDYPCAMCFCHGRKYLYISTARGKPKFSNFIKQFTYS